MSSLAYMAWRKQRHARIRRFIDLRMKISQDPQVKPDLVRQFDELAVVTLAAEFQGFARHLHNIAIGLVVAKGCCGPAPLAAILTEQLEDDRKLDYGNANAAALGADFGRFHLQLWRALKNRGNVGIWQRDLNAVIKARNAVAHDSETIMAQLEADGITVSPRMVNAWLVSLDSLAKALDDEVGDTLGTLMGEKRPW